MKSLKVSKYNFYVRNEENELLIYNSLNYKFIKISKQNADEIENVLRNSDSVHDKEVPEELIKAGVFIPANCDELALVNNVYMNCINNDGVLTLVIVVTEDCNFRCPYCFERHEKKTLSSGVKESIIKFVQKNIYKYKGLEVIWFGGEPLLEIETIIELSNKFIEICKAGKKAYVSNISTNGYYLNLDNFKKLVDCNVINFQVTIDGVAITHDKFRVDKEGNGTFDVIIKNLMDIRKHMNYGMYHIGIRTNYTKESIDHIDEFIGFLNENFAGDNKFSIFPRATVDLGGKSVQNMENELFQKNFEYIQRIFRKLKDDGINLKYEQLKRQLAPGNSVCYACKRNEYGIDVEGGIFKCNDIFQSNPEWRIGNVTDGKFVINKYEEAKWIKTWNDIDEECKNCCIFPVCLGGGCALMTYRNKYLGEKKKKNCMFEKSALSTILQLLDKEKHFTVVY